MLTSFSRDFVYTQNINADVVWGFSFFSTVVKCFSWLENWINLHFISRPSTLKMHAFKRIITLLFFAGFNCAIMIFLSFLCLRSVGYMSKKEIFLRRSRLKHTSILNHFSLDVEKCVTYNFWCFIFARLRCSNL